MVGLALTSSGPPFVLVRLKIRKPAANSPIYVYMLIYLHVYIIYMFG